MEGPLWGLVLQEFFSHVDAMATRGLGEALLKDYLRSASSTTCIIHVMYMYMYIANTSVYIHRPRKTEQLMVKMGGMCVYNISTFQTLGY